VLFCLKHAPEFYDGTDAPSGRIPTAALSAINDAAAREGKSSADYIRIAGLTAVCHTFWDVPPTVFLAPGENMTPDRARALGMQPVAEMGAQWQGEVRVRIGKNGFFHDNAGGIWVLEPDGLRQRMGFEPAEETERLEVLARARQLEARTPYAVTRAFTAFRVQKEEGSAQDQERVETGLILFADPEFWKGKLRQGQEVIQFTRDTARLYVDRRTFMSSTRRTVLRP
jgi:hypothetical protein